MKKKRKSKDEVKNEILWFLPDGDEYENDKLNGKVDEIKKLWGSNTDS